MNRILFFSLIFLLNQSCIGQNIAIDSINNMLQGRWVMVQDSSAMLIFNHDTIQEFSIDFPTPDYSIYKISNESCYSNGELTKGSGYYMNKYDLDNNERLCYFIVFITKEDLELVYIEGGRVLNYKRRHR